MTAIFRNLNWPMRLIGLALVAAFCFVLAKIVITLTNPESIWTGKGVAAPAAVKSVQGLQNFTFSSDPFNSTRQESAAEEVVINSDVPETTLNLKLTGHIAGEKGSANLRTPDNKEAAYRIGDEVISDVILKAVNKDFVVLSVNGQLQRLTVERAKEEGFLQRNNDSTNLKLNNSAPSSKALLSQNVLTVIQNLSFDRSIKNGQVQGYTIKTNRPDFNVRQFGIEKGDLVTEIDGKDITTKKVDFLSLFQEASQKGNIEITVLRNGQSKKIELGSN